MKKLLFIIVLIISLFSLSCNHNKLNSSLTSSIGKVGEITVNPLGVTPLSAVYTTATVNATPITVTVKGLYGEPDIIHTYPAGYGTEFEIHGMFPESQNTIEVNDGGRIITKNVYVESLPNGIQKKYDVAVNNLPEEKYPNNPELYFVSPNQNWSGWKGVLGISDNGYIRYANTIITYFSKIHINNSKISFFDTYEGGDTNPGLYDLFGNRIIKYPTIAHHDVIKVDNNYIYLSISTWGSGDRLVEMNSYGSKVIELSFGKLIQNTLDLKTYPEDEEVFKKIVFGDDVNNIYVDSSGQQKLIDWFHANSLVYDSSTDILYVSSRERGVLAINYSEWRLIWWMADDSLLSTGNYKPYQVYFRDLKSLEPYRVKGDVINDGPKNQHALFLHKNGNLGMFDNQGDKATNPNGSRYVEYKITGTHGNYTAQKVYEYRDSSLYSRIMSDVDFTGENYQNLLLTYADPTARILEVEKNTKNVLFRVDLPFYTYRVEKMPLYYDEGRVYSEDCNLKNPN
ncbi:aryl-sulfate sulfotransferase [Brachyspira innocens]|uniref:aryl-sulfate sulfotransferase n=1 Tax=Brachyspira innocens TaxID=13264 RepID=UPI00037B5234|nr:aryl-sulfate sulfotransferase [Brachyspira innocens]